jgi:hypothetical protein
MRIPAIAFLLLTSSAALAYDDGAPPQIMQMDSFLYSPISPTTTTREASAIAYLSADIEDSRTDLSMGNNHKSLDKIADDSAGRMHKLTIILLVVLVIGIYGLVSDIRAKK